MKEGGVEQLIETLRKFVFTNVRSEYKELYRIGHQRKGLLSRQAGESMVSYITRRRRWWTKVKNLSTLRRVPNGRWFMKGIDVDGWCSLRGLINGKVNEVAP